MRSGHLRERAQPGRAWRARGQVADPPYPNPPCRRPQGPLPRRGRARAMQRGRWGRRFPLRDAPQTQARHPGGQQAQSRAAQGALPGLERQQGCGPRARLVCLALGLRVLCSAPVEEVEGHALITVPIILHTTQKKAQSEGQSQNRLNGLRTELRGLPGWKMLARSEVKRVARSRSRPAPSSSTRRFASW